VSEDDFVVLVLVGFGAAVGAAAAWLPMRHKLTRARRQRPLLAWTFQV